MDSGRQKRPQEYALESGWASSLILVLILLVSTFSGLPSPAKSAATFDEIIVHRDDIELLYKEKQEFGTQRRRYLITCVPYGGDQPVRFNGGCVHVSLVEAYVGKRQDDRLQVDLTFNYRDPALIVAFLPANTTFFQKFGRKAVYDIGTGCVFVRAIIPDHEFSFLHISEKAPDAQDCIVRGLFEYARIDVPERLLNRGEDYANFAITFLFINASTLEETLAKTTAALARERVLIKVTSD